MTASYTTVSLWRWVTGRQRSHRGGTAHIAHTLATSHVAQLSSIPLANDDGAIFDIEFQPHGGGMLAGACERRSIVVADAHNSRLTHRIPDAHRAEVNVLKFYSPHLLASGSDDRLVHTWDVRTLGGGRGTGTGTGRAPRPVATYAGHEDWVKSVAYHRDGYLVTAGFDGRVILWPQQQHGAGVGPPQSVVILRVVELVRVALSADDTQLYATTRLGLIVVVSDFRPGRFVSGEVAGEDVNPLLWHLSAMGITTTHQQHQRDMLEAGARWYNRVRVVVSDPPMQQRRRQRALVTTNTSIDVHPRCHAVVTRCSVETAYCRGHITAEQPALTGGHLYTRIYNGDDAVPMAVNVDERWCDDTVNPISKNSWDGDEMRLVATSGSFSGLFTRRPRAVSGSESELLDYVRHQAQGATQHALPQYLYGVMSGGIPQHADVYHLHAHLPHLSIVTPPHRDTGRSIMMQHTDTGGRPRQYAGPRHSMKHYEPGYDPGFIRECVFACDGRLVMTPMGSGVQFLTYRDESAAYHHNDSASHHDESSSVLGVYSRPIPDSRPHQSPVLSTGACHSSFMMASGDTIGSAIHIYSPRG